MTTDTAHACELRAKVVEAYRLDRYDNLGAGFVVSGFTVVEAYRLDRYDNPTITFQIGSNHSCRSLSFG